MAVLSQENEAARNAENASADSAVSNAAPNLYLHEDYQARYASLRYSLERDHDEPFEYLEELERRIQAVMEGRLGDAAHAEYFISTSLPQIVKTLLDKKWTGDIYCPRINQFFQCVLGIVVRGIPHDIVGLVEVMRKLFDEEKPFYLHHGHHQQVAQFDETVEPVFSILPASQWASAYLVENVNFFGRLGGFNAILDRIRKNDPRPRLDYVSAMVDVFIQLRDYIIESVLNQFIEDLRQSCLSLILSLTDDELRYAKKEDIESLTKQIEHLLTVSHSSLEAARVIEQFALDVALKCFRSPYLDKRINGLTYITDAIDMTRARDQYQNSTNTATYYSSHYAPAMAKWLTTDFLLDWLNEHQILQQLFGQSSHTELAKRSVTILRFMASKQKLDSDHLDLIWEAATGKHQAVRDVIYKAMGEIALYLNADQLKYIFNKINSTDFKDIDSSTLNLVKDLTKNTQLSGVNPIMDLLWTLAQDESIHSGVSVDISTQALQYIQETLANPGRSDRFSYIAKCIQQIREGRSVVPCMQIIKKILGGFPEKPSSYQRETKSFVCKWMERHYHFRDLNFESLMIFKRDSAMRASQLLKTKPDCTIVDLEKLQLTSSRYAYLDEIKQRLEMIQYFFSVSDHHLSVSQVNLLWDGLICNSLSINERDLFYKWLIDPRTDCFDTAGVEHLFVDKMLRLDFRYVTVAAFQTFQKLFAAVNKSAGKLLQYNWDERIEVLDADLIGIDSLWEIVLQSDLATVAKDSAAYLNKIYSSLAPNLKADSTQIHQEFIKKCMSHLEKSVPILIQSADKNNGEAMDTDSDVNQLNQVNHVQKREKRKMEYEKRISRCLVLLKTFLDKFDKSNPMKSHASVPIRPLSLSIQNFVRDTLPRRLDLNCNTGWTVGKVRKVIGQKTSPPLDYSEITLFSKGSELSNDDKTLYELKFNDGQSILVHRKTTVTDVSDVDAPAVADPTVAIPLPPPPPPEPALHRTASSDSDVGSSSARTMGIQTQTSMDDEKFNEAVQNLVAIFAVTEVTAKQALKKAKNDVDEAGIYLSEGIPLDDDIPDMPVEYGPVLPSDPSLYRTNSHQSDDYKHMSDDLGLGETGTTATSTSAAMRNGPALPDVYNGSGNGSGYDHDESTAAAGGSKTVVAASTVVANEKDTEATRDISNLPSAVLSDNQTYFALLFDLLTYGSPVISEHVWSLLMIIPTNRNMLNTIRKLQTSDEDTDQVDWNSILDSRSIYRLLYTLQIVDSLLTPSPHSGPVQVGERAAWRHKFLTLGGFEHLYSILMCENTWDNESVNSVLHRQRCLSYLIKVLKMFLQAALTPPDMLMDVENRGSSQIGIDESPKNTKKDFPVLVRQLSGGLADHILETVDMQQLIQRLLNITWAAAKEKQKQCSQTTGQSTTELKRSSSANISEPDTGSVSIQHDTLNDSDDGDADVATVVGPIGPVYGPTANANYNKTVTAADQPLPEDGEDSKAGKSGTAVKQSSTVLEDNSAVEYAMSLLVTCILSRPELVSILYNFAHLEEMLVDSILLCPSPFLREYVVTALYDLCKKYSLMSVVVEKPPHRFILELLLKHMPNDTSQIYTCDHYFQLVRLLVQDACKENQVGEDDLEDEYSCAGASQFVELLETIVQSIKDRPIIEDRHNTKEDNVLHGLMSLLTVLLQNDPSFRYPVGTVSPNGKGMVLDIYESLFSIPTMHNSTANNTTTGQSGSSNQDESPEAVQKSIPPPRCKNRKTRKAAYDLLTALIDQCEPNYLELLEYLSYHHRGIKKRIDAYDWGFDMDSRAASGYVGLKNLGCTCYMNSLLQQFFMIPMLRLGILGVQDNAAEKQDSPLYQLQVMFGHLQESEKQYYNPAQFCSSFKGYDGEPINVMIQQDVDEFFNLLCDKLDNVLKGSPQEHLLRVIFGGKLCHEIISLESEYPYHTQREEPFYTISLDIKNKKSILEAFDLYVQGDRLEGDNKYACDEYDRKIDALKRCCIKELPNTLIVHLKRFEFDFNLMQKVKLNDYCEFPLTLNMKPWTKEGLAEKEKENSTNRNNAGAAAAEEGTESQIDSNNQNDSDGGDNNNTVESTSEPVECRPDGYYEYHLVGVLVHSGTADVGHYYSFVKERNSDRWFEFNDTSVTPFNVSQLQDECFGGQAKLSGWSTSWSSQKTYLKSRNAYMLIYERKVDLNSDKQHETHSRLVSDPAHCPANSAVDIDSAENQVDVESIPTMSEEEKERNKDKLVDVKSDAPKVDIKAENTNDKSESATNTSDRTSAADIQATKLLQQLNQLVQDSNSHSKSVTTVPPEIYKAVWEENMEFLRDQQIFDPEYFNFMEKFFKGFVMQRNVTYGDAISNLGTFYQLQPDDPGLKMIRLCTWFILETLSHSKVKAHFSLWTNMLKSFLMHHIPGCKWFIVYLIYDSSIVRSLLLDAYDKEIRSNFAEIIVTVAKTLGPYEYGFFLDEEDIQPGVEVPPDTVLLRQCRACVPRFYDLLVGMLEEARNYWKRFNEYYWLFREFSLMGYNERRYLVSRDIVGRFIDQFMGEHSPWVRPNVTRIRIGDKFISPNLVNMCETVANVTRGCATAASVRCQQSPPNSLPGWDSLGLYDASVKLLFNRDFFYQFIRQGSHVDSAVQIMIHWGWEDSTYSKMFMEVLMEAVDRANWNELSPILGALGPFLALEDSLQRWRVEVGLNTEDSGLLDLVNYYRPKYPLFAYTCLKWLMEQVQENGLVATYVSSKKDYLDWAEAFLKEKANKTETVQPTKYTLQRQNSAMETFEQMCNLMEADAIEWETTIEDDNMKLVIDRKY